MSGKFVSDFGIKELNDRGLMQVNAEKLADAMEFVMQGGRRISVEGVVSTPSSKEIVFRLEDCDQLSGPEVVKSNGLVSDASQVGVGISVIPTDKVVEAAEAAKKKNLAMRILGPSVRDANGAESVCVQCYPSPSDNQYPQDFWMNRVSDSDDMTMALMSVVERRS